MTNGSCSAALSSTTPSTPTASAKRRERPGRL
jgi:hypothetical protein